MEESQDSGEESVDSEQEETLPICVQGDLARLRRNNSELKKMKKVLKMQLEKSQLWASKLETEVAELKSRIKKLGEQLEGTVPACQDSQTTQTDEEDIKEAAWLWQYGDCEQGEQDWKVGYTSVL